MACLDKSELTFDSSPSSSSSQSAPVSYSTTSSHILARGPADELSALTSLVSAHILIWSHLQVCAALQHPQNAISAPRRCCIHEKFRDPRRKKTRRDAPDFGIHVAFPLLGGEIKNYNKVCQFAIKAQEIVL